MMRRLPHVLPLLLLGCAPPEVPEVSDAMVRRTAAPRERLESGRIVYLANCHRCHEQVPPGELDPEYWRQIVPHMARNARLGSREQADVLNYLIAAHLEASGVR